MHPLIKKLIKKFKVVFKKKKNINSTAPDIVSFAANKKLYNFNNVFEYFDQLKKIKNCLVIFAVRDTTGNSFDSRLQKKIGNLGLKENLIRQWRAYIAILANGSVIYEKKGSDKNATEEYRGNVEGLSLQIVSKPWEAGNDVSIKIDDLEYSMHIRGINIVVWDLKENRLLDSVAFDTHRPSDAIITRRCLDLDYRQLPKSLAARKQREVDRLLGSPIVLIGKQDTCLDFAAKFGSRIRIRQILFTDQNQNPIPANCEWKVTKYAINKVYVDDLLIVCPANRAEYITIKKKIEKDGLTFSINYLTADIADALLSDRKICVTYGYCQIQTIFSLFFKNKCQNIYIVTFHQDFNISWTGHNLLSEFIYILLISDIFIYNDTNKGLIRQDFKWTDFCTNQCIKYKIPRMAFSGLTPQTDIKDVYKLNKNAHIRIKKQGFWIALFPLIQGNYEKFVDEGMSNDEIYNIVSNEDYIPQEKIISNFKYWIQYLQVQEADTNLKMTDYILDNYKNIKIYRDQSHHNNNYYYEVARRINRDINLLDKDMLETILEEHKKKDMEILDFSDIPVLPCVAKALDIKWATPDYQYNFRLGDNKTRVKVTFREYIYMYCDFMRSMSALKKMKVLN